LKNSAIILAGGVSKRFGQSKGLVELRKKPLILHVLDRVSSVADDIAVVVSSDAQREQFERFSSREIAVIVDEQKTQSPLVGALTGFNYVRGEYSLLLPCDTPFLSIQVAQLLLDMCVGKSAAIPRWPDGYIEPLQAAYHTESTLGATKIALEQGKLDFQSMIAHLRTVRYISTIVLRQVDPKLMTFVNINTPEDLKKAESVLKMQRF
jgi:molybdopterin-guanine dinucleotide biosynthesis protein A